MPRGGGAIGPDFRRTDVESPEPIRVSNQLKHSKAHEYPHLPIAPSAQVGMWNTRGMECGPRSDITLSAKAVGHNLELPSAAPILMFGGRDLKCG
jgi:hypothetical protein